MSDLKRDHNSLHTGEPPPKQCPSCNASVPGFCTLATGREHLHNGPASECCKNPYHSAARPSEPSAPRKMIDVDGHEHDEDAQCKYSGCKAAPQTSAEPAHPERKYHAGTGYLIAAPQPVSGDAPDSATFGSVTCNNAVEPLIEPDQPSPMIFAPKVEDIARKLHLYHCQERRSGSICPCHVIAEGMSEGCHCKEETADIAATLRPYFPTSQTPTISADEIRHLVDCVHIGLNGSVAAHEGFGHPACIACKVGLKLAATPASTARTDGWVSVEESGLPKVGHWCWVVYHGAVQRMAAHLAGKGFACADGYERRWADDSTDPCPLEEVTYWQPLPAAPGSVPQAPKDECLYGPVGKHIFNPHDDEPRRCVNCGVPQAEPPKEEKP